MVERFLEYSLANHRKIKVFFLDAGQLRACNILVTKINSSEIVCATAGRKTVMVIPVGDILSASYSRGDTGDTLCNSLKESNDE